MASTVRAGLVLLSDNVFVDFEVTMPRDAISSREFLHRAIESDGSNAAVRLMDIGSIRTFGGESGEFSETSCHIGCRKFRPLWYAEC